MSYFLLLVFVASIFVDKKLENKSFSNMKMSKSSIHKLINFSDDVFLNEDYKDLIFIIKNYHQKMNV